MNRVACPVLLLACLMLLAGCVATIPDIDGETMMTREVRSPAFWSEAARVATLSGTDEPAPAVHWLRDKRTTVTFSGGRFTTFQTIRVKTAILDADRADEFADVVIPTSPSRPVKNLSARTVLRDGSCVEVRDEDIHERSRFPGYALYTDLREKVFAMPAFEDSCVVEYQYTTTVTGPDLEDLFIMSDLIPVKRAYYSFGIPSIVVDVGYNIGTRSRGISRPPRTHHQSLPDGQLSTLIWEPEDIPAINDEHFMPPYRDVSTRVTVAFDISPECDHYTWTMLGDEYYEAEIAPLLSVKALSALRGTARDFTSGCDGDLERVEAVCNRIVEDVRYVAVGLEGQGWTPRPPSEVLRTKYGDCKDMTMLAVTLLQSLNIDAQPALLMTRSYGTLDTTLVAPSSMNHMILAVDTPGKRHWVDLTAGAVKLGALPSGDRGAQALLLSEQGSRFETIPAATSEMNEVSRSLRISIDADGMARGQLEEIYGGDLALSHSAFSRRVTRDEMKEALESLVQEICPHAVLSDWSYDSDPPGGGFTYTLEFETDGSARRSGERMILDGHLFSTAGLGYTLPQRDRTNQVLIRQPLRITQQVTVSVPEDWRLESMPEAVDHACVFGTYERNVGNGQSAISCDSSFELLERRMPQHRYEELRGFVNAVEQWNAEPVVLVHNDK